MAEESAPSIPVQQAPVPKMDIREFREFGYLQELNRQFLHPLGLALATMIHDDGSEALGFIIDARNDPEGFAFMPGTVEPDMAQRVEAARLSFIENRRKLLGWEVQPAEDGGLLRETDDDAEGDETAESQDG